MTRSAAQNQKMRDERREQILSSGLKVFAARGLAGTKITDIAADARISQGLLYHYFRSKEDIFVELIRGALERMNEAARGLEKMPLAPAEKIALALRELVRGIERDEDFARYFLLIAQATASDAIPERARAAIRSNNRVPYEVIARILRAGQRDGSVREHDADELSVLFWTLVKGLAIHRASHGSLGAPDPAFLTRIFLEES